MFIFRVLAVDQNREWRSGRAGGWGRAGLAAALLFWGLSGWWWKSADGFLGGRRALAASATTTRPAASNTAPATTATTAAATTTELSWFKRGFEDNLLACGVRGGSPPDWCATWITLMEAGRPPELDPTAPEWRRVAFERSYAVCVALRPPDWCDEWKTAMADITRQPAYLAALEAWQARNAEAIAATARETARREAWQVVVKRVGEGRPLPGDYASIERKAEAGDADAMELLAWMNVNGVGLKIKNFARAYEMYGRAVVAGRIKQKENLDKLWPKLTGAEKEQMLEIFSGKIP